MNTPLSRLQHDLSLAPGIPDSYRLFGEGPTVSTYGDLRAVVGQVDNGLLPGDLEWLRNLSMDPSEPEVPDVVEAVNARIGRIVSALSAVPPSQGTETPMDEFRRRLKRHTGEAQPHPDVSGLVEGVKQVHSDLQFLAIACDKNDPKAEISIRVSDALAIIQDRIAPLLAAFQSRQDDRP